MERILIVRLGAMGDVVHALPAVAALRRAIPGARIGWVVEQRWAELLSATGAVGPAGAQEKPLVDQLHLVDTKAWRAALFSGETWREVRVVSGELTALRYDAAIDFQGLVKSAFFASWSGAPTVAGFARPKERVAAMLYTRCVETSAAHVVEQNLELVATLAHGAQIATHDLLPRAAATETWCEAELRRRAIREFVVISPGAGWGAKVWPGERYGQVARSLAADGLTALVNFGPGEEELARSVVGASGATSQAIQCSVGELVALTRRARLFVGGDSGPMHMVAALRVPVVAIFGPTDPARNGPYGTRSIVLRSRTSETSYSHRAGSDPGLLSITADEVSAAARQLLEPPHA